MNQRQPNSTTPEQFHLRILAAHKADSFNCIAYSPDGQIIAAASDDTTIKLWDTQTGKLVRTLEGHQAWVSSVAFAPEGGLLATGSYDKTVKLWEVGSGKLVRTLAGHQHWVSSVAFAPEGGLLATGSDDKTVKLWEVGSGQLVRTLAGHYLTVRSVAFAPEGGLLATSSDDKTVKLWEVGSGQLVRTLVGHQASVRAVAFAPEGGLLATGSADHSVKLWEVGSGQLLRTLVGHQDWVTAVAFAPEGRLLATGSADKTVKLWEVGSGQLVRTLEGPQSWVRSVAFVPEGGLLATGSDDKTVKLWEVGSGQLVRKLAGHQDWVSAVAFAPEGGLLATGSDDKTVKLWEVRSGQLVRTLAGHQARVSAVAFAPEGGLLATGSDDKTVKLWEVGSGQLVRKLAGHQDWVSAVAFAPEGGLLATGSDDKTVKLWEVRSGQLVRTLAGHQARVSAVAFAPEGGLLATGSADKTVKLWEVGSGQLVRTLAGHYLTVRSVAFAPEGGLLATGSDDKTVKLWEVGSGQLVRMLAGHQAWVSSVAFAPEGGLLASGSYDNSVKLWEVGSGKLVRTLEGHQSGVIAVTFAPESNLLASASVDGTVKLWDVMSGAEIASYQQIPATHSLLGVQFCPVSKLAESFGETVLGDPDILAFQFGTITATATPILTPTSYTSAKVVVIGESSVGKSCLSLRLATGEYQELGTTHGMRTWEMTPEQLDPAAVSPPHEERKIFLWDLGGQQEYRLVHQLFLPETTLALLLFDPTRGKAAFDDVREWNLRLKKQTERPGVQQAAVKLLVGTKLDTGEEIVDRAAIQQLLAECGCADYLETSAKSPRGLAELGQAILNRIKWDDLSKTTRPRLFQLIRDLVTAQQQRGEVVLLYDELEKQVRAAAEAESELEFDAGAVNTVIQQLAGQGQIVETCLSGGERVLVLQIGFISLYAGSLVLAARDNARGVPVLEELQIVSGRQPLPGLKAEERVDAIRERIVLECTVQLMLDRGLCFRHEGMLIFPTEFKRLSLPESERRAQTVTIYYDFTGAIDNIWASLVTQLALSDESEKGFGRIRLWKDHAEFEKPDQGVCGLQKVDRQSGLAHLDLLFSEAVTPKTRDLFARFVDEHLRKVGVTIKEGLKLVCPNEHPFNEEDVKARIAAGKTDIGCATCDARVRIGKGDEAASAATARELVALKTDIQRHQRQEINELKGEFKSIEVFISYSHRDEALREELGKHLSALRREKVIDLWHDRRIDAGMDWAGEIDRHLETASVILLLISADFIASDYCYSLETKRALARHAAGEAVVIPIVLRPTDWLTLDIAKLQALPRDNRAVTSWANRDEAFLEVAQGIRQAVKQLLRPELVVEAAANAALQFVPQQPQRPPLRLLHLSDLHFGAHDDPLVRLQPLLSDLRDRREGFGLDALDYLVITGDLTNRGAYEEFERVHEFLSKLVKEMKLSAERTLIVPGNHDLSWEEEVYDWKQARLVDRQKLSPGSYVEQGKGYLVRDDARYPKRFTNFARFHHEFKQLEFALKPEAQFLAQLFHETGLQFLAFNSAWQIDEFHPHRASLHETALAACLHEADQKIAEAKTAKLLAPDATVLRLALWHHPITGNEKITDDDFVEQLRKADVRLCLHGHVHESREDLIGYLHPTRKLYVAGAGSFGAVAADRPPATPKLYNLIEIPRDLSLIRVHTRGMHKEGGAWRAWPLYPGNQSCYEIKQ